MKGNSKFRLAVVILLILCSQCKKSEQARGPENFALQAIWLYTELDFFNPNKPVPVDGSGFNETHYFYLYNPTIDTITLMQDCGKSHTCFFKTILLGQSNYSDHKYIFFWGLSEHKKVLFPNTGIFAYCIRKIDPVHHISDTAINAYFARRKEELLHSILVLEGSNSIVSFNKCNIYDVYLRNVDLLNHVTQDINDSTFRTNDTLFEFYWLKIHK